MPFIDVFSLLCIFLLSSSIYISIAIHKVQVPFLSNAKAKKSESKAINLLLDASINRINLTKKSKIKNDEYTYKFNMNGLKSLNIKLAEIKNNHKNLDKITLFIDDGVVYSDVVKLVDHVKINLDQKRENSSNPRQKNKLFHKIIFGSVIQ